ncbi:MAG TPA: thiamine pyrophosphate-dependent dehydrogenase E1 component subunit alpha [Kiritimatiellia bacterium]|nr:thiamine pyrophosphate-dependent dehydrogenase E1 component subunit alpha [Kiritimatiellia bacterium]
MEFVSSKSGLDAVPKSVWTGLLRTMVLSRRTEERLIRLYHQAKIYGGVYTGVGQEAIGSAITAASGPEDLFTPLIRNMTVHIGRGESTLNIFRQWLARASGPTRGRDGNVHYGNFKNGVYTMISHLGAMLPVIVGGVMAKRRLGLDTLGFGFIGDGGTSTGDFHEAVNFAAVYDVPVVFVIENNHYAYSTPQKFQYKCEHLASRAAGYGIDGYRADGNDAVGLMLFCRELAADLRAKPRPVLLECDTLRMRGHGEHDDASYVDRDLVAKYAARDPIKLARERLIAGGIVTEAEVAALDQACLAEVDAAYRQALKDPAPDPATLAHGVYADA